MAKKEAVVALAVTSRIKDHIKAKGLRSDGELDDAVNKRISEMLDQAAARCKANNRSTVRPADL